MTPAPLLPGFPLHVVNGITALPALGSGPAASPGLAVDRLRPDPAGVYDWLTGDRLSAAYGSTSYEQRLGFFCVREQQFEKMTHVPLKFRLGSLAQCNWLEGKAGW